MVRLLFLSALASAALAQTELFVGSGTISVLNATSYSSASPADAIGCLDASGAVTLADCAVYTRLATLPYSLSTSAGNCTFRDSAAPTNADSAYADVGTYAWTCKDGWSASASDEMNTVSGFNYPFICTGDVSCWYDVQAAPEADDETMDAWRYYYGSAQSSVPAGHVKSLWLWVPVNNTS